MKKMVNTNTFITGAILILLLIIMSLTFTEKDRKNYIPSGNEAQINLYGEAHGVEEFYSIELKEWEKYYFDEGARDLYVELPYYEGQLLNEFMKEDNSDTLYYIYDCLEGTASHTQYFLDFYSSIKEKMPETVFHATDLGHQYYSLGNHYLELLESRGLKDSDEYIRTQEIINQGYSWYEELNSDNVYREEKMAENFIWDYRKLVSQYEARGKDPASIKIMGIYGGAHTVALKDNIMAGMIRKELGDIVSCRFLSNMYIDKNPYEIGFSYLGLIFLVMLFVPNIIFGFVVTDEIKEAMADENKVLFAFERVGEVLACITLLLFPANNPRLIFKANICLFLSERFAFWVMAIILMIIYEIYWIRFFRSSKTVGDFFYSMFGIPLSGASLPCLALLCIGIYSGNFLTILAAVILSVGHIGIHYTDRKRWVEKHKGEI